MNTFVNMTYGTHLGDEADEPTYIYNFGFQSTERIYRSEST
jgi:hypothetical protein